MTSTLKEFKEGLQRAFLPALLLFFLGYILYHMFSGNRGLLVWHDLSSQIEELRIENARLEAEVLQLEEEVMRLSSQTLDPDYLDELVRRKLGYAHPDEQIAYIVIEGN